MSSDEQAQDVTWYIKDLHGLSGPYSEADIREKLRQGKIDSQANIRQGNSSWRKATEVQKLFEELEQSGWYFQYSTHTLGPYTPLRLLDLIESGRVPKGSTVRCGSSAAWMPIETAISALREAVAKLPKPNPLEPLVTSAKKTVSGPNGPSTLRKVADQVGLQAQLKSIQMLELPKANLQLGLRAFEYLVGHEKLRKYYSEIEATDKAIILARQPIEKISVESIADKAARVALEAKRRLEIESLQMTRRTKIAQLGAAIANDPTVDQSNDLGELIAKVQRLQATRLEIESRLEKLTSQSWPWRRLIAVSGLIAIGLVVGYWYFRPLTASERLERAIARSEQELLAEQQAEWEEEEESLRKVEMEAEQATAKAAAEMERLEREIQRRRERSDQSKNREELDESFLAATTKLESELRTLEMEEQERKKATELKLEKEKDKVATQKSLEIAQENLRELCASLFDEIDLVPTRSVALSKYLVENGVEIELRGTDIESIHRYLGQKDWLSLINLLLKTSHVELPDASLVREAVERLRNYDFQILLKVNSPVIRDTVSRPGLGRVLASISVDTKGGLEEMKVDVVSIWMTHPDGIGFVQPWSPDRGRTVIAIVPQEELHQKCNEFQSIFAGKLKYYDEKAKLGEISSEMLPQRKMEEVRFLRDRVMAWALVRNDSFGAESSERKEVGSSLFSLPKQGKYQGSNVNIKTGEKAEPVFVIFSEDIVGYVSGKSGTEIAHLWVRDRSHPIERMGLYVYRLKAQEEDGILVVQSFDGSKIALSGFVGGKLDTVDVLRDRNLAEKANEIRGQWIGADHRVTGVQNAPKKSSLPRYWRDLLSKHAPSCLVVNSKSGK